ncbi:MAG: ABC transporter ATP-binding protein [Crocinitomicaceae bacterium]|nr:ABC transporter ATP-binding protein [Crocinitomicaceae bacterium]
MSSVGKAFDWNIFKRLYGKSRPYKKSFIFTAFLVFVLALLSPVRPEQMRRIIDVELPAGNYEGIVHITVFFISLLAVEAVIQYFQSFLANRIALGITTRLRTELYSHLLKFRLRYYDRTPVGQLVTRHISDIDGIAEVFSVGMLDIIRDLLKLIVIVCSRFFMDWKMTLVILLPVPVLIYSTRIFQMAVKKSFNDVRNEVSRISVFIQEHVTGMNIVQIFNREKQEKKKFETINREHRDAHIRGIWAYSVFFPVVELLAAASVSLMLWWGLKDILSGHTTPGTLLLFSTFISMMFRPIRQMADNFNVLQMGVVNAERVFKILDRDGAQSDEGKLPAGTLQGAISFRNVSFGYSENIHVLKGINLEIHPGEMLAFVGATGAGKSSIANLLNRFYDFQKGELLIDGHSIQSYKLSELRKNVGLVLQDVFLFSDTIYNNIALHNPSVTREMVVEVSKLIGTHEFISKLPGNYDFNVRERGGMLSVGQRQLLSFVRAYISNPRILVLDEATSSVDTESEQLIRKATEQLTKDRTSIVIAHRLSTIQKADRIVVLEKGEIAEEGTHHELLEKNGHYRRLFDLQFDEAV